MTTVMPPAATAPRAGRRIALCVLLLGAFLPPLDFFIVNLAMPAIEAGLHTTGAQLQLIASAYSSTFGVCLVTGGRLGDLYGRKRMFMLGMTGFVLASAACAFAPTGGMLVLARIVQAAAAAVMAPQVLATIRTVFAPAEQTRVMSFYGFVFGLSAIVGQLLGGALITLRPFGLGWQSVFWINVPVGLLGLAGAAKFIPENQPTQRARIDLPGVALLSVFLVLLIYPLTHGREAGWPWWTWISFAASVPVLLVFIATERRIARRGGDPLVDLALFGNFRFVLGLVMAFLFYCVSAFFLVFGIYLQRGLGWSALASGVAILPFAAGFVVGPLGTPALSRLMGDWILALGFAAMGFGFAGAVVALHFSHGPGIGLFVALLCAGTGQGLVFPSIVRIVLAAVGVSQVGLASGLVTSTLQLGSAFAVATIGGVFFSVLGEHTGALAYQHAFAVAVAIIAALQLGCIGLCWVVEAHHARQAA